LTFRAFPRPSPHHGRSFRCLWGLGIVSVFLHACVDYPFSRPALGSWFIVMLAMLASGSALAAPDKAAPNWDASDEPVEDAG
jgi:hypothetical protein